jgi:succinate-semialdehyde dehydrogenase/glutarate-semialdehyde dehydrogenase
VEKVKSGDIAGIVNKARAAHLLWMKTAYHERAARLKKARSYLASHIEEIAEIIHADNGKLRVDALAAELLPALLALTYYIKTGRRFLSSRKIAGGSPLMFNKKSRLVHEPWGVVGIISPWNYPFAIPFSEVVMALLAGNAVILKVSNDTLEVGRSLAAVFAAACLPPDLFNYVEISGREAGPAFISGGIDKLFFTGSTAVGRELMRLAAPRLLPLVLELGGADAAIIRKDADLDRAALGVLWSGFSNAGQSCGGAQRIFVHSGVYAVFLEKLCALVNKLEPGLDDACGLGPMTTIRQKEAVEKQVAACIAMGAKIAAQSPPPALLPAENGSVPGSAFAGNFTPAVVLSDLTLDMPVMTEEIFGPVAGVYPVADDEEAVNIANSSSYGLSASVWSSDHKKAKELASRLNAGSIMINDHLMSHGLAQTPWGGFGDSGLGRTHGEMGFAEMLKTKVIVDETLPGIKRNLWWHPYSLKIYRGLLAITELLAGSTLFKRLGAVPRVLSLFFRYWQK